MSGRQPTTTLARVRPADLRRLRWGQTVSMFGDEITSVALPTVAVLVLHATPFEFGVLTASTYLPYPVLGLLVGVWVDRVRRRQVLMLADSARFFAVLSIPVAALMGVLTIGQLFAVGIVVGTASVFFNSAYQAFLPSIVRAGDITAANAKLSVSETSSQVGGPPLAGLLISAFGAAGALFVDATTFLVSILGLTFIRRPEVDPATPPASSARPAQPPSPRRSARRNTRRDARNTRREARRQGRLDALRDERDERRATPQGSLVPQLREGLRLVFSDRLMRGLTLTSAMSNLGRGMALELFLLFAYNGLQVSPGTAGVMLALGNVGSLLGSLTSRRVTGRLGIGPTLLVGSVFKGLPWVLAPLTLLGAAIPLSIMIMMLSSYFVPISNVTTVSIRQSLVPREVQGRVAATTRTVTRTVVPLSALLGGVLAQAGTALLGNQAGLAAVLALGGLLWTSATVLLPRARLRRLHSAADLDAEAARLRGEPVPEDDLPSRRSASRDRLHADRRQRGQASAAPARGRRAARATQDSMPPPGPQRRARPNLATSATGSVSPPPPADARGRPVWTPEEPPWERDSDRPRPLPEHLTQPRPSAPPPYRTWLRP